MKPNVSSNTEVILFDKNFTQLLSGNRFLGLDKIKLEKKRTRSYLSDSSFLIAMDRKKSIA